MTAVFEPADVRITEQDGFAVVDLDVDAERPADSDWDVRVPISSIIFDAEQPCVMRVSWRGSEPSQP
jgi:hypothetical protein